MSEPIYKVRDLLDGVTGGEHDFKAKCPAHDDNHASLHVTWKTDRVLMRCFAGCTTEQIMEAAGLVWADLFEGEPTQGTTVVRSYLYETGRGEPWFWKDRYFPKDFRLRLPGTEQGSKAGLNGRAYILYHLPKLVAGIRAGKRIYVVEGEKDVETCERHGLVATTPPSSDWRPEYTKALVGAGEVVIIADQDKIKPDGTLGKGHTFAIAARDSMRAASIPVKVMRPASGKDATDHFMAGHTEDDFIRDTAVVVRPKGLTAQELRDREFEALKFSVYPILPEGLAILAAPPKQGKSWIALGFSLGVACGGLALDGLRCIQGDVLYLAREDGARRIQSRLDLMMAGDESDYLDRLEVVPADVEWQGGDIGLANMTEWAAEVEDPRLVVLDTFAKVEPQSDDRGNRYKAEYATMAAYKSWADKHRATVLMIHHDNKSTDDGGDIFNRMSGTKGLTGAADTLLFLQTKRGEKEGVLHVTGRDVSEQSLAMTKVGPLWSLIDPPTEIHTRPRLVVS